MKWIKTTVTFLIFISLIINTPVYAYDKDEFINKELKIINVILNNIFKLNTNDYYTIEGEKGNLNRTLFLQGNNINGVIISYGKIPNNQKTKYYSTRKDKYIYRYLGYTVEGGEYENIEYPWDGWDGTKLEDFNYIIEPWKNNLISEKAIKNKFNQNQLLEPQIIEGLNYYYDNKQAKDIVKKEHLINSLKNKQVYTKGSPPTKGGKWIDYVYIMQPPTYRSWGVGRAWHKKGGRIYYLTIPIAPFGLNCKDTTTNAIIYNKLDVTNKTIYSTVTTPKQYKIQLKTDFTTTNKFLNNIDKIDWYKIKQKDLNKNQLYDEKSLQYVGTIKNPKQSPNYLTTYIDGSPEGKQHIFGAKITL